ncbi:hypothetical protein SEA_DANIELLEIGNACE_87 [Arthrobacter phage DanielleIgnace]|nr:hypothetical protein SEA_DANIELLEIGNACE_87 [Arthrobacter phage DanielleIgnace]
MTTHAEINEHGRQFVMDKAERVAKEFGGTVTTWAEIKAGDTIIQHLCSGGVGNGRKTLIESIRPSGKNGQYRVFKEEGRLKSSWDASSAPVVLAPAE